MIFLAYLRERFPVPPYALLVVLFYAAASGFAVHLGGGAAQWWAAPVMLFTFFHLRVFDEHKDFAVDKITHPERLLSRGSVSLGMLKSWGAVAIVAQIALSTWIGPRALLAWAATFAFTVAMRFEFGVGAWLNRHILLYALTHNPVVALLAIYAWATTGAEWNANYGWFLLVVSLGSLGLEVGRKTRLAHEEVAGVASYSSVHGRARAGLLVYACIALSSAATLVAITTIHKESMYAFPSLVAVVFGRLFTRENVPAKRVELGASLALLLNFGALTWAAAAAA